MARRATKAELPDVRFASVLKAFLCCLLIGGVAVGYVQQTHKNSALTIEFQALNDEIDARATQNALMARQLMDLLSPETLDTLARHLNLDLAPPRPGQVVELQMPGPGVPMIAQSGRRYDRGERRSE